MEDLTNVSDVLRFQNVTTKYTRSTQKELKTVADKSIIQK